MGRKLRSDSNKAAVDAMRSALAGPVDPPEHVGLREGDRPFWDSIVQARAANKWNDADLEVAANLARCKADIERVQAEITAEGDVVVNARGTQIMNPKHTILEILSRRCMALSRILHVHAEATQGKSRDQTKQNKLHEEMREAVADDELIPRPQAH